jgi:hypothetical protein
MTWMFHNDPKINETPPITDPSIGLNNRKGYSDKWVQAVNNNISNAAKIIVKQVNLGFFVNSSDLVSPPPFLPNTYSMGKYEGNNKKTAIIEMRGYSRLYDSKMKMGPIILQWFNREFQNAYAKWDSSYIVDITKYKKVHVELSENMQKTDWYKDEAFASIHVKLFENEVLKKFEKLKEKPHSVFLNAFLELTGTMLNQICVDKNLKEAIMKRYSQKKEWVLSLLKEGYV